MTCQECFIEGLAKTIYEADGKGFYVWEDRFDGDPLKISFRKLAAAILEKYEVHRR